MLRRPRAFAKEDTAARGDAVGVVEKIDLHG